MKELLIIRHAESKYNVRETSDLDSEITEEGHRQAKETAEYLAKNYPFLKDFVGLVSPLYRTLQTAQYIHKATGVNFLVDPVIREKMVESESFDIKKYHMEFPEFDWSRLEAFDVIPLFKETMKSYMMRMLYCFHYRLTPGNYVLVSHGTPCQTLARLAQGIVEEPIQHDLIKNCAMSWILPGENRWFNEVVHT